MTREPHQQAKIWFSGGASLVELQRHDDARGSLLPVEFDQLPFAPQHLFTVSGMPAGTVRGGHAHRDGEQLLICLQGEVGITLKRHGEAAELTLQPDGPGLLVRPKVWCRQTYRHEGSVLLVVSSRPYDPESYIDSWDMP